MHPAARMLKSTLLGITCARAWTFTASHKALNQFISLCAHRFSKAGYLPGWRATPPHSAVVLTCLLMKGGCTGCHVLLVLERWCSHGLRYVAALRPHELSCTSMYQLPCMAWAMQWAMGRRGLTQALSLPLPCLPGFQTWDRTCRMVRESRPR